MPDAGASTKSWLRWLVLVLIVAAIGGFYVFGLQDRFSFEQLRANVDAFKEQVDENLIAALVVFFVVYAVMAGLSIPAAWVLTMVAGALFGRFLGATVAVLAADVGATLAFLSSRFLFRDWVQARFGSRLDAFNKGFEKDGAYYLFSLRLVPLFPFFVINLAMGLTPIRTWTYFWVSLIGMLPGSFLYANAGSELATLDRPGDVLSPTVILSLILLGIAPLVFRKALQWRNATPQDS